MCEYELQVSDIVLAVHYTFRNIFKPSVWLNSRAGYHLKYDDNVASRSPIKVIQIPIEHFTP